MALSSRAKSDMAMLIGGAVAGVGTGLISFYTAQHSGVPAGILVFAVCFAAAVWWAFLDHKLWVLALQVAFEQRRAIIRWLPNPVGDLLGSVVKVPLGDHAYLIRYGKPGEWIDLYPEEIAAWVRRSSDPVFMLGWPK